MATESQIEAFIHAWKTGFISDTMKLVFDYAEWKRVEVGGDRGPWVPFSQGEVETFLQLHRSSGNRFAPLVRAKALILLPENMIGTYYKYPQGTNPGVILPTKPGGRVKKDFSGYFEKKWPYETYESLTPVQHYLVRTAPNKKVRQGTESYYLTFVQQSPYIVQPEPFLDMAELLDGWAAQVAFDTADGIADDIINTSYGWIKVGRPPQGGNLHLGASCVDQEDQSE